MPRSRRMPAAMPLLLGLLHCSHVLSMPLDDQRELPHDHLERAAADPPNQTTAKPFVRRRRPPPARPTVLGTLSMEELRHHGGEAAVGLSCGALAAWLIRRIQSTATTVSILASIGSAAALHMGWATPEQVRHIIFSGFRILDARIRDALKLADLNHDNEFTLEDSRIAAAHVTDRPTLAVGLAGGLALGLGALR
ncbi:hypothetical protein AB1Y20_003084 [Prymnesium parvum]|uniref:EF-hand domain-containing protein n=1 Tax=Prymnesium parvum TaxID=97485 RepID=A0AB34JAF2_PRYPA|mmetsp:Transcript_45675/g.113472  ORF Transcript_45675/g.113472 Transcript_45675/m.113472 type:complete len:195 (-) Transcript_45675:78-662(-)